MKTWLTIDAYAKLIGMEQDYVKGLVESGELKYKLENGEVYIETDSHKKLTEVDNKAEGGEVLKVDIESGDGIQFVEKTIGTILNMHEKVIDAKDETLETLKSENAFLKDALLSMQELYDEDRKTIETLTAELNATREELEFVKRKYKLMWGKVIQKHGGGES